jgi:hypothetical protein
MMNTLQIAFSFIGLFFLNIFSDSEVVVQCNMPETIAPGQKQKVEIVINKSEIQGFSKLDLTLPAGFTATADDTKGASFTFSGQKARFVWMTLPTEATFTVSYTIESAANIEGKFDIIGNFSYVKDNKRQDFSIPTQTLFVKKPLTPGPAVTEAVMSTIKKEEEFVELTCTRTITKVSDTEYNVNLKVVNNNIQGFARILETLPENCRTEKTNDGGAVVTQDRNNIKFVWFEVPTSPSFEASYKVSCASAVNGDLMITGKLSFVENMVSVDVPVMNALGTTATTPDPLVANNTVNTTPPDSNTSNNTTVVPDPIVDNTTGNDQTPDNNSGSNSNTNTTPVVISQPEKDDEVASKQEIVVADTPSPETGISYKVQILAAHRVVDKTYFKKKFSFTEKYNIENHEGWVKYTTGKYAEYKKARDAREDIKSKYSTLPGPFVTAYNEGERITVQEALLISNQQWFK